MSKAPTTSMAKTTPAQFLQQVRQEIAKVTWPTRKETLVTSGMVFLMVMLIALFFLLVDQVLSVAVRFLLGIGA
jgi:preprotein translocase subunit SecE